MHLVGHVTSNEVFLLGMVFGMGVACGLFAGWKLFARWMWRGRR